IKAEREAAKSALKQTINLTPAERVADFMKDPVATSPAAPVIRTEAKAVAIEPQPTAVASAAGAGVGVATPPATVVTGRSGKRSIFPTSDIADEEDAEEMVKGASVLRVKAEAPATSKLPFEVRRVNYSD